jgi:Uncharacterised nucleotidyltransferase
MPLSFSREFLLAAACSIWPPSGRRIEAIREAAAGSLDWDRFFRVVMRHRIIGLVHDGLTHARPAVPAGVAREIGARAAALVRQNLALTAEAIRLQRLFDEAGLPVAFVKGPSLAILAYGNLGLRHSKDIDILVSPDSLPAATTLVKRAGYCRFEPPVEISNAQLKLLLPIRRDFGYVHDESRIVIELHWRLFANPHFMDEATVMASTRLVPLTATMSLRTFGDDDLFTYLCAHGALHSWHQLKWLADIGALLASAPIDDLERLYRAAETKGVGRPAAQAILLCQRLLGTTVPSRLVTTLVKDVTVRWLESTALQTMIAGKSEIERQEIPFGTTRGNFACFLLRRNWRFRLAEAKINVTCQTDVLTVPLPARLHFLYPFLRLPLWLWRHRPHGGRLPP